jgi:exodeoxyribonuclease VII small subunit
MMSEKERPSFEEALRKLESIVKKLEDPEVTLEESIELYEEGMKLSKYCSETLEDAVLRIEKINTSPEPGTEPSD